MFVLTRAVSNTPSFQFSHNPVKSYNNIYGTFYSYGFYRCLTDYNNFVYGTIYPNEYRYTKFVHTNVMQTWVIHTFSKESFKKLKESKNGSIPVIIRYNKPKDLC